MNRNISVEASTESMSLCTHIEAHKPHSVSVNSLQLKLQKRLKKDVSSVILGMLDRAIARL